MREIELHELEIFQVIERFAEDAFERSMNMSSLMSLPSRQHESQTAKKILAAIAYRKLEKFEAELTEVLDCQRRVCQELSEAFEPPYSVDSPAVLKRKIQDLDILNYSFFTFFHLKFI